MKLQDDLSNVEEFENELPKSLRILWELFQNANPETYTELKEWLEIYNSDAISDPQDVLNQAKEIHHELYYFLLQNNYPKLLAPNIALAMVFLNN